MRILCALLLSTVFALAANSPTPPGELLSEYDVIIAGAGTGGFGAAVQAARLGATVLLLEETDWIGGEMKAGSVTPMGEGAILVRGRGIYPQVVGGVAGHHEKKGMAAGRAYGGR